MHLSSLVSENDIAPKAHQQENSEGFQKTFGAAGCLGLGSRHRVAPNSNGDNPRSREELKGTKRANRPGHIEPGRGARGQQQLGQT